MPKVKRRKVYKIYKGKIDIKELLYRIISPDS